MKRLCFLFCFLMTVCLALDSFAGVELKPIQHQAKNFSISLPTTWEYALDYRGTSLAAHRIKESETDLFSENLSIISEVLPLAITAEQYYERNLVTMKQVLKGFKVVSLETVIYHNRAMVKLVSTYHVGYNKVKAAALFATRDKEAFVITLTSLEDFYPKNQELFDFILASFVLP